MAYVGMTHVVTAPYLGFQNGKPTYGEGYTVGEGISTEITPNYNEGSLYGDNAQQEYIKEFKNASIKLGVTSLPIATAEDFFGHTVDKEKNEIIYKTSDSSKYVGIGLCVDEIIHGQKQYVASWIYKTKFNESAESYETKGDSIVFKTPSLEGVAIGIDSKSWKIVKTFETEEAAIKWLNEMANIKETETEESTEVNTESLDNLDDDDSEFETEEY